VSLLASGWRFNVRSRDHNPVETVFVLEHVHQQPKCSNDLSSRRPSTGCLVILLGHNLAFQGPSQHKHSTSTAQTQHDRKHALMPPHPKCWEGVRRAEAREPGMQQAQPGAEKTTSSKLKAPGLKNKTMNFCSILRKMRIVLRK